VVDAGIKGIGFYLLTILPPFWIPQEAHVCLGEGAILSSVDIMKKRFYNIQNIRCFRLQ
jgi:hypothetical protein